jgi:hypothetical protein
MGATSTIIPAIGVPESKNPGYNHKMNIYIPFLLFLRLTFFKMVLVS